MGYVHVMSRLGRLPKYTGNSSASAEYPYRVEVQVYQIYIEREQTVCGVFNTALIVQSAADETAIQESASLLYSNKILQLAAQSVTQHILPTHHESTDNRVRSTQ